MKDKLPNMSKKQIQNKIELLVDRLKCDEQPYSHTSSHSINTKKTKIKLYKDELRRREKCKK